MDRISSLPLEVAQKIFFHLDLKDIRNGLQVSDRWADIMADNNFCRKMCKKYNVIQTEEDKRSIRCTKFIESRESPIHQSLWEYYLRLDQNWLEKSLEVAKKYSFSKLNSYMNVVYFDEKIITIILKNSPKRNYYYNIEVRNNSDMKIIDTFPIPDKLNQCIQVCRKCNFLVVGLTFDKYTSYGIIVRNIIKQTNCWKIFFDSTVEPDHILFGVYHFNMAVNKELVAAEIHCEERITLKKLHTGETKFYIDCEDVILDMKFYKEKLFILIGIMNKVIQIWDTEKETKEIRLDFELPLQMLWSLAKLKEFIVFSSELGDLNEKSIKIFNIKEKKFLYDANWRSIKPVVLRNYRVVCLESENCVKIMDMYTGNLVTTIIDNENNFYEIIANSKFLISATRNDEHSPICKFKIFDFYSGTFLRSLDFTNDIATLNFRKGIKTLQATEGVVLMHYHKDHKHKNQIFYLNFDVEII